MTYKDKTWCMANCIADGKCGRKLTETDLEIVSINKIPVSFADFSENCELFIPGKEEGDDAFKGFFQKTH